MEKEKIQKILVLEKLVAEQQMDADIRVAVAAEFSLMGLQALAAKHYRAAIMLNPDCDDAYDALFDLLENSKNKAPDYQQNYINGRIRAVVLVGEKNGIYVKGAHDFLHHS